MKRLLFTFSLLVSVQQAEAAACCGGSSAIPSLITGDDKAQLTSAFSQSSLLANVDSSGNWKHITTKDETSVFRLDGAFLVSDFWQMGMGIPMTSRHLGNESSNWSLGDISLSLGYEILPDWDYSVWRPHGLGFIQLTAPSGKSVYDENPDNGLNISGKGFWNFSAGAYFSKVFGSFDASVTPEFHRSMSRKDPDQNSIVPGWGRSLSLAGGWNKKDLRLGLGLSILHEDAIRTDGAFVSAGSEQNLWTGLVSASYLWTPELSSTLSYTNQTLFGQPTNSSLGQSVSVSLQQRWPR